MKRLIWIICWGILFLPSCNFSRVESSPQADIKTSTPGYESGTDHDNQPTATPLLVATTTSTTEPMSSSTAAVFPETPTPVQRDFSTPQQLALGKPVTITKIKMFDTTTGWGTGYQNDSGAHILYTEDGGSTWVDRTPPEIIAEVPEENESVWTHFMDPWTAWVIYAAQRTPPPVQPPVIWRTKDGGITWEASYPVQVDGMEDFFTPEGFASWGSEQGWLLIHVGGGMSHDYSYLFATSDGGITWERIADPYGIGIQTLRNTGLAFADSQFGWVSKDNLGVMPGAFIEQTIDGGTTWDQVFLPTPPEIDWFTEVSLCKTSAPTFTKDQAVYLIVKCRLREDIQTNTDWSLTYIYKTVDRGETWEHFLLPSPVESIIILDKDFGWALGRVHFQTTDGGGTWELVKTVNWDGTFSFIDSLNGWAVARNQGEIALVVTEDGGQSWQIIESTVH